MLFFDIFAEENFFLLLNFFAFHDLFESFKFHFAIGWFRISCVSGMILLWLHISRATLRTTLAEGIFRSLHGHFPRCLVKGSYKWNINKPIQESASFHPLQQVIKIRYGNLMTFDDRAGIPCEGSRLSSCSGRSALGSREGESQVHHGRPVERRRRSFQLWLKFSSYTSLKQTLTYTVDQGFFFLHFQRSVDLLSCKSY